jgi:Uma2 family endonuclease
MAGGMANNAARLTYDDLVRFPDDGKRHELIGGEHFVTPSPGLRHQAISMNLSFLLSSFLRQRPLGKVFHAPFDVVLTPHDVVEPDLLYVSAERREILTAPNVQGAPDLAIEILSPSSRRQDELLKRDLYERTGVAEYWIVDPEAETVKVFRRAAEGRFGRSRLRSRRAGDVLTTPLLPGLEVPLGEVFAD